MSKREENILRGIVCVHKRDRAALADNKSQ